MKIKNISSIFALTALSMLSACAPSFKPSNQDRVDYVISREAARLPTGSLKTYCDGFKKDMAELADFHNDFVSFSVENVICSPTEEGEVYGKILAASAKVTKTFTNCNIDIFFGQGPVVNGSIVYIITIQNEQVSFKSTANNFLSDQIELDFQDLTVDYLDSSNRSCAGAVRVDNSRDCSVSSSCEECL